ncbi:MAG TPA: tol-pal system protein YbgF [Desulfuromonadales bacterium]|nr:tol-pal system protein YbgF [Desulfuromonadales bacterium]
MKRFALLLATAVWVGVALSGCAVPAPSGAPSSQLAHDFAKLQQDQRELDKKLDHIQNNLILIEARVQDQQKVLEQLRQKPVAEKGTPNGQKAETTTLGPAAAATASTSTGAPPSPTEIYLKAFADYAAGRYSKAANGFATFLKTYPDNDFASNARYWLGECFYAQQQYPQAVAAFQQMLEHSPQGAKAPDALLKMAAALKQMGQNDRAEQALQALRQRYPDSAAAKKSLDNSF